MMEKSEDSLRREMQEEINTEVKVGRLVWVVENFFKERDRTCHEIDMFYRIKIPSNSLILNSDVHFCRDGGASIRFKWFKLTELKNIDLRPVFLKKALQKMPVHTEHIVWYDD